MARYICLFVCVLLIAAPIAAGDEKALNPARVAEVDYYLRKIETKAQQARGMAFQLNKEDERTLRWIMELAKSHPEHTRVKDLVARAKVAYTSTKGIRFKVTPEMLAYRDRDKKLAAAALEDTKAGWAKLSADLEASGKEIENAFPAPSPFKAGPDALVGKSIVLADVNYEEQLVQNGLNWIAVGSATDGYYFIDASSRSFDLLYAAYQKYKRVVSAKVPAQWTVVGRVTDIHLLAPDSGGERRSPAVPGWIVEPTALYLPGTTLVLLDEKHERGARFTGEERLEKMRAATFTVTAVPENAKPKALVEVLITALKEKNWDLYLECLHPDLHTRGGNQLAGLRYNWDLCQKGLAHIHAHAEVTKVEELRVLRGRNESTDDLNEFFGEKTKPGETAPPDVTLIERVTLWVTLYDERGMQTVSPRPVVLERKDRARWYVMYGATLTF